MTSVRRGTTSRHAGGRPRAPQRNLVDTRVMADASLKRAHPLLWVPTLYFAMGTPMIAVSVVAAIMYKDFGLSNTDIALYTGMMYLPWVIKPLWAPLLELKGVKRTYVLAMEIVLAIAFVLLAVALGTPFWLPLSIVLFWIAGFASATQDIVGDGVYITSSTEKEQAMYIGVQGMFWNLGRVLVSGVLVSLTKKVYDYSAGGAAPAGAGPDPAWQTAWAVVMGIVAAIMILSFGWHLVFLPPGQRAPDAPATVGAAMRTTLDAWVSFFKKKQIWMMIVAVFFYRFGEGFIEKLGPLFLKDPRSIGGLELDNYVLGNIIGSVGTLAYIGGTVIGGALAARYSVRKAFFPLAFALNIPHITYFYLSQALPTDVYLITFVVGIEKVGYGMGTCGMMLYMMQQLAPGPYKTAHYAFATGIMALTMMLTGMVSGKIQELLGYQHFFLFVLLASVPPILIAWFAPFPHTEEPLPATGGAGGH